jgi:hypothetical protein
MIEKNTSLEIECKRQERRTASVINRLPAPTLYAFILCSNVNESKKDVLLGFPMSADRVGNPPSTAACTPAGFLGQKARSKSMQRSLNI